MMISLYLTSLAHSMISTQGFLCEFSGALAVVYLEQISFHKMHGCTQKVFHRTVCGFSRAHIDGSVSSISCRSLALGIQRTLHLSFGTLKMYFALLLQLNFAMNSRTLSLQLPK